MPFRCIRGLFGSVFLAVLGMGALGCGLVRGESGQSPSASAGANGHVFFRVQAATSLSAPLNGRLLIFVKPGSGDKEIDVNPLEAPTSAWVAAREVTNLAPGSTVDIDADEIAFPQPFSSMPVGNYEAQAVLDVDHSYNYSGRSPEDWASKVVSLSNWTPHGSQPPVLTLDRHPEEGRQAATRKKSLAAAKEAGAQKVELNSALLGRFWGHPVTIQAWVILPPGYDQAQGRYPTAYWTHGFGGDLDYALTTGLAIRARMNEGKMPPMIWVMLDESIPQGTHEFADSVNNGPWGAALTTEFIPYLEAKYRMDGRATGRLLNGHSSGGWATLQLEVNYPKIFGGTWSTSPDPSDFHRFSGVDLYAPDGNLYRFPDGSAVPIVRARGKVVATMQQLAGLESVLGPYGGQLTSFEWVFSPKGPNGAPEPMFDRQTGKVDPKVVAYWRDHYDLAQVVEANWQDRGADLKGRIHLFVGTADTFYLDGAAHLFEARLNKLGGEPHFTYIPDRSHFDVYGVGGDSRGLFNRIGAEMYAVARPGSEWKPK